MDRSPQFIVDCGAYSGCSNLYFANKYPNATVVALEAEESNYRMLLKNTCSYANVHCTWGAIWSKRAQVTVFNPEAENWSFRVRECAPGESSIQGITVEDLLSRYDREFIDILKLDVEGSEMELLSSDTAWLNRINVLIVELHERYAPGVTEAFRKAISHFSFNQEKKGENIVLKRT